MVNFLSDKNGIVLINTDAIEINSQNQLNGLIGPVIRLA
jgi:hypothetical protein